MSDWKLIEIQYNVYIFENTLTYEELPFMAKSEEDARKQLERYLEGSSVYIEGDT